LFFVPSFGSENPEDGSTNMWAEVAFPQVPNSRAALSTRVVADGRTVHLEVNDEYEEANRLGEVQRCFQVQNDLAPYID
jgi:hypothetical protein